MQQLIKSLRECRDLCACLPVKSISNCGGLKNELDHLRINLTFALSDAIKSSSKVAGSVANNDDIRTVKEVCHIIQVFEDLGHSSFAGQCSQIIFSAISNLLIRLELLQMDKDLGIDLVANYDDLRAEIREYILYTSLDNDNFALVDVFAIFQKAHRLDYILSKCYGLLEDTNNEFYQRFSRANEYMHYIMRHADRLRHNNYDDKYFELLMLQEELGFLYSIIFDGAYFSGSNKPKEIK